MKWYWIVLIVAIALIAGWGIAKMQQKAEIAKLKAGAGKTVTTTQTDVVSTGTGG